MSRSEHHPRFEQRVCDWCRRKSALTYCRDVDDYLCDACDEERRRRLDNMFAKMFGCGTDNGVV